jgi:hypothetical protein
MKQKSISLLAIFLICCNSLIAQKIKEPVKANQYTFSIGMGMGSTTGSGISARFIPKRIGFQVNLFPTSNNNGKNMTINTGLTLLGRIVEAKNSNLYVYLANNYIYKKYPYKNTYNEPEVQKESNTWNTGLGMGVEFATTKKVVFNVMIGLGQYNALETITLAGEIGLYYRFNKKNKEEKILD